MNNYEGVIVELTGGAATIEIVGRLGQIKLPLRMIVNEKPLEIGQKIRFAMTYPEVIEED
jgi:hypothetical protein